LRWSCDHRDLLCDLRGDRRTRRGCLSTDCTCAFGNDYRARLPDDVTLTSIYSREDGVVQWQSCVAPDANCVEVTGSHVGLAFNRKVYRAIAEALARGEPVPQTNTGAHPHL
jgi:triacylglycerol lipase